LAEKSGPVTKSAWVVDSVGCVEITWIDWSAVTLSLDETSEQQQQQR